MTCEEFARIACHQEHDPAISVEDRAAASAHGAQCPACAAMQDSWLAAKADLRSWAVATEAAQTPARVEMRLRQEFRARHGVLRVRRAAVILPWGLAAAVILFAAFAWMNWRNSKNDLRAKAVVDPSQSASSNEASRSSSQPAAPAENLFAGNSFTLLPGSVYQDSDDASVVRVRMQRGSLTALGLPINEDRAGEWIQVDLLVTDDGLPQAVRLSP